MAKKSNRNYSGGVPYSIRIQEPLEAQLKEVSEKTNQSIPDLIRLAAATGLHSIKRLNYDIARAIDLQAAMEEEHARKTAIAADKAKLPLQKIFHDKIPPGLPTHRAAPVPASDAIASRVGVRRQAAASKAPATPETARK